MSSTLALAERSLNLSTPELFWSLNYDILLGRGYRLRNRFKPGAIAEFMNKADNAQSDEEVRAIYEDGFKTGILDFADDEIIAFKGMDAVRTSDGEQVWIKRCISYSQSSDTPLELALNLAQTVQSVDGNHCLPLLDHFTDQSNAALELAGISPCVFLVFPLGVPPHEHPWRLAAEAIEFVRQLLEGLVFLHGNNVAHGDIHIDNLVMDPRSMFPQGIDSRRATIGYINFEDPSPCVDRIEVLVKYYYIDLGLSTRFDGADRRVTWRAGYHKLPEVFGTTNPTQDAVKNPPQVEYDAFAGDVWQLGTTLHLLFGKSIPSLCPLLRGMTERQPDKRPTAQQCLVQFHELTDGLSRWELLWPVRDACPWRDGQPRQRVLELDCFHFREWARLVMKAIRLGLCKPEQRKRLTNV